MKEELKKSIGHRMRRVRKSLGYTQEKMVSFFDIGRANYSRIEKGEVSPTSQILHTLRNRFNVSLDWLITNKGRMFVRDGEQKLFNERLNFGEYTDEIMELLSYMAKVPMVKHALLGYFLEYRIKHKDMIQEFLEEDESANHSDIAANGAG